jgi:colanic acid/amylovoran biosynthesis glycosyltransferase
VRIGYLVSQYPAPSHTFIRREIDALRRNGLGIETFSVRPAESLSDGDQAEEARTFYVLRPPWTGLAWHLALALARHPGRFLSTLAATLRHRLPGARSFFMSCAYFVEAMRLAAELRHREVTHLHNHFANPASHVGLAAARYLGIGWSVTLHGLGDFDGPTTPLLREKVAAARFVACATHYGRAQAMRLSQPELWTKLHVVRCGIEPALLPAIHRQPRHPGRSLVILSVGRLSPEKGQLGLIEAFATAVDRGLDARLVLVGDGPDRDRVHAAVVARRLEARVELRGRQAEAAVLEAMADADVFAMASFMEGLPVVLMEAMAMGLPVVAPAITGIPELVVHGETGLLFAASHWDELAEALLRLAGDPALRTRLAASARRRLLPEFDVDASAVVIARLFREAHDPGPPADRAGGHRDQRTAAKR